MKKSKQAALPKLINVLYWLGSAAKKVIGSDSDGRQAYCCKPSRTGCVAIRSGY